MSLTSPRPIEKEDLFRLHFLQSASFSPDGERIAYSVASYDEDTDRDLEHIWIKDLRTGRTDQLTFGNHVNSDPSWSPDGSTIAFLSSKDGSPQIFLIQVDGGRSHQLTRLRLKVAGAPVWSPNGDLIAFTAGPDPADLGEADMPYRVTRTLYRSDGYGYLHRATQDIYVVAVKDRGIKRLTQDETMNTDPNWSPDGSQVLYLASLLPESPRVFDVHIRTVDLNGNGRELLTDFGEVWSPRWLPDGRHILFASIPQAIHTGGRADLYTLDTEGKSEPNNRTDGLLEGIAQGISLQSDQPSAITEEASKICVLDNGNSALVEVQKGGSLEIHEVSLFGEKCIEPKIEGERACYLQDVKHSNGLVLFASSTIQEPLNLCVYDLHNGTAREVTELNRELLAGIMQPSVKHIPYLSEQQEIEAWLLVPADAPAPYPTILYIHGGPDMALGHVFFFDLHMLTAEGYAVLLINQRGSSGYGERFSRIHTARDNIRQYTDLMAGVDHVIGLGLADRERLGVCGLSNGGFLTCWIVGHTQRFKAAVAENPVTNYLSFFGVSDFGPSIAELMGGFPHEAPEVYRDMSPITYAHRCRTPTLLIQCEEDFRCPPEQSEQFYTTLRLRGCITEMVRLPGSSHAGSIIGAPKIRRAQNDALLEWMNRFLLGESEVENEQQ
jgi:dipeptidyl aminopeptidase/acylaminoacyl peptidase